MGQQPPDGQAALHLEMGVEAGAGLLQGELAEVHGHDLHRRRGREVGGQHGDGIGLLSGGAARAQDPQAAIRPAGGQFRQQHLADPLEHGAVAEEARFLHQGGFHHLPRQDRIGGLAQLFQQGRNAGHLFPPGDRAEAGLDEEGLVGADHHARMRPDQGRDEIQVGGGHMRPTASNFEAMMSPSKGFMMYSAAP